MSLGAGQAGGVVETVPLRCAGDRLVVNADAAAGELTVEVLDEQGRELPGYAAADCLPLRADAVRHPVRWKEHERLNTAGPVRLRFHLSNARLYSYAVLGSLAPTPGRIVTPPGLSPPGPNEALRRD